MMQDLPAMIWRQGRSLSTSQASALYRRLCTDDGRGAKVTDFCWFYFSTLGKAKAERGVQDVFATATGLGLV
jgi:hypothetical protein